jgi:polyphosphate kinase
MSKAAAPKFLNRELSWLEFNQRVLDEACTEDNPLLERLKFLAITASNLDEFFMVRVGGLRLLTRRGVTAPDAAGLTPHDQLAAIGARTHQMTADQYACFASLEAQLAAAGIRRVLPSEWNERQAKAVEQLFDQEIFAILTPMAVRPGEEFPHLVNQTLNVAVQLAPAPEAPESPRFAVIPIGKALPRIYTVGAERGYAYVLLEEIVERNLQRFFPGETVVQSAVFRITRNADFTLRDDLASDLVSGMEEILSARKYGECVRLEIAASAGGELLAFLKQALSVRDDDLYAMPGPLDLTAWMQLGELPGYDALKNEPWPPQRSPLIDPTGSMFEVIAQRDILLYHPYESFEPVVRLVEEAASDPDVLAIKQILYRTSRKSPIVAALARAAQRGKHVTAVVELKARFDEARNIEWARNLEEAGVQVIYGVKGLKTHAKLCVIVRREPQGIQRYLHFGTGNYNEITSKIYSDASLLTVNEELGADAVSFFNAITGYSQPQRYRRLEAAPTGLRARLLELIEGETQRKKQNQPAFIQAKLNAIVDPEIIHALYMASQAGVTVRLNVRGACCLCPGVRDQSENIEVISIVDRYLEHARILHFHHGGDDLVFISSADWMPRNIDRRIELLIPIQDPDCRNRLIQVLQTYFEDNQKARRLRSTGDYEPVATNRRTKPRRAQEILYRNAVKALSQAEQSRQTIFEPHRAPEKEA